MLNTIKKAQIITQYLLGAVVISLIGMYCIVTATSLSKRAVLIDLESRIFEEQTRIIHKLFSTSISDISDLSIDSGFISLIRKNALSQYDQTLLHSFLSKTYNEESVYKVDLCLTGHDLAFFDNQTSDIRTYQNLNDNVLDQLKLLNTTNAYWKREHNLKYFNKIYKVISYIQPIQLGDNRTVGAIVINYDLIKLNNLINNRNEGPNIALVSKDFKNVYSLLGSPMEVSRFSEYINTKKPFIKNGFRYTLKNNNMFLYSTGYITDIKLAKLIQKNYFNDKLSKMSFSFYVTMFLCCFLVIVVIFAYIYITFTRVTKFKGGPLLLSNIIKNYEAEQKFYFDNADMIIKLLYSNYINNYAISNSIVLHLIKKIESAGKKKSNICGLTVCILSYTDYDAFDLKKNEFYSSLHNSKIQVLSQETGKIIIVFEIKSLLMDQIEIDKNIIEQLHAIYLKLDMDFITTLIGKSVNSIEEINMSLKSAEELYGRLFYTKRGSFISYNQERQANSLNSLIEFPSFSKLVYAINKNAPSLCNDYIEKTFEYIESTNMSHNQLINSLFINLYEVLIKSFSKQVNLACLHDIEVHIKNLNTLAYTRDELYEMTKNVVNNVLHSVHSSGSENSSFTKVLDYIHANSHRDLSLNELSDMFGVASQYFSKVFKDNMGTTLVQYLTDLRLNKALEYLENTDMLVKDIATKVGYSNPQYFIRVFNKKFRCSPLKFKRQRGVNDEKMVEKPKH